MTIDFVNIFLSLIVNTVSITILSFGIYFRRHRRRELATGYVAFGTSLFVVSFTLSVAESPIGIGIGFGLFAILSIVRLRSDEATWNEIGYTMVSIVLGVVNGLIVLTFEFKIIFSLILLISMFIADHPAIYPSTQNQRFKFILDKIILNTDELKSNLSLLLEAEIKDLIVLEIDLVRETMVLDLRIKKPLL